MKVSQIVALSAALALQAQACVRVRVDRVVNGGLQTIQDLKLYDNDAPVKILPNPINFSSSDDETTLHLDAYAVTLQYKGDKRHPYGGRISYPKGSDRDLQGKAYTSYSDANGFHDVYCFTDNYDNCGAYECGVGI